jgi:hypothetical protein
MLYLAIAWLVLYVLFPEHALFSEFWKKIIRVVKCVAEAAYSDFSYYHKNPFSCKCHRCGPYTKNPNSKANKHAGCKCSCTCEICPECRLCKDARPCGSELHDKKTEDEKAIEILKVSEENLKIYIERGEERVNKILDDIAKKREWLAKKREELRVLTEKIHSKQ